MMISALLLAFLATDPSDPMDAFVGRWSHGAPEVEGYQTVRLKEPSCADDAAVVIERVGPDRLRRTTATGTVEMFVRQEGDDWTWASREDGPRFRVRFVAPDSFQLAGSPGETPDWRRSRQLWRCPAA